MNRRIRAFATVLFFGVGSCTVGRGGPIDPPLSAPNSQATKVDSPEGQFDPLKQITANFPDSIKIKNKARLLEFCPDGTCDGFVVGGSMPVGTLKDFSYLFVYFFSDYTFLDEWRAHQDAKNIADRILSKPEYHNCKNDSSRDSARCVLLDLTSKAKIKLIFVRYDEGERHAVPREITELLAAKKTNPKGH